MIQTVNYYDFRNAFQSMDRGNQFSYEALTMLFDWLEQYEEDTGEQVELDVIALCCDYSEMEVGDIFNCYPIECDSEEPTEEEVKEAVMNYLNDHTLLIGEPSEGVFLFQQF